MTAARPLSAIVAATRQGVIGRDGDMPWQLKTDLRRFKHITMGGAIIMGRRTFESLPGLLPGRRMMVLSRDPSWSHEGAEAYLSVDALLKELDARPGQRAFVVGGGQIYDQLLPICKRLYLTRVESQAIGDTKINLELSDWKCTYMARYSVSSIDDAPTEFSIWDRSESRAPVWR